MWFEGGLDGQTGRRTVGNGAGAVIKPGAREWRARGEDLRDELRMTVIRSLYIPSPTRVRDALVGERLVWEPNSFGGKLWPIAGCARGGGRAGPGFMEPTEPG